jgi:class 3 adenylate cyclase
MAPPIGVRTTQRELTAYNDNNGHSIHVRIGIHAGEPFEEGDNLFGSVVQMAARICTAGQAGDILASGRR